MTNFTLTHTIGCDLDTFWKFFFDKDFNLTLYRERLQFPDFAILEQTVHPDGRVTRKTQGTPKMALPGPVAKVFGPNFRYTEDGSFDPATKVFRWNLTPSTLAGKLRNEGNVRAEPAGEGKVRRITSITIEAKVLGVGGIIESSAEKQFRDGWEKSAVYMNEWVAKHRAP